MMRVHVHVHARVRERVRAPSSCELSSLTGGVPAAASPTAGSSACLWGGISDPQPPVPEGPDGRQKHVLSIECRRREDPAHRFFFTSGLCCVL